MDERVNESISWSIFNATRTGNGFNKVIMYTCILSSKQEREILFEATRTKLDVCSMRVRFATQQCDTSVFKLINNHVKYFAKVNSAFTILFHRRHGI